MEMRAARWKRSGDWPGTLIDFDVDFMNRMCLPGLLGVILLYTFQVFYLDEIVERYVVHEKVLKSMVLPRLLLTLASV